MKMQFAVACAAVALASAATTTHAASLVTNGSFEQASPRATAPMSGFATVNAGETVIDGWTVGGHSVDWIGTYWQASDGQRSIDLSGNGLGSIYQSIATQAGQFYRLSFDLAGNPDGGDKEKSLLVDVAVDSFNYTFDVTGWSKANMGWQRFTLDFVAQSNSTMLSFASDESVGDKWGPALDNVSVTAVPVPGAAGAGLMMLGALGGLRLVRRARRA